jgi:heat shock protein HslJ
MRRLHLALAALVAMTPAMSKAETITGRDWMLLAMDGLRADFPATLRIEDDGSVIGTAPCNTWASRNSAALPDLALARVRATRMACDSLAEEQTFLAALALMNRIALDGPKNLILTAPGGRSMEFELASVSSLTACKTCLPME